MDDYLNTLKLQSKPPSAVPAVAKDKALLRKKNMEKTTTTAVIDEIATKLTADESSAMIEITKHNEGEGE